MSKKTPKWTEGLFPEAATKDAWEAAGNKFHDQIGFTVAANEEDRRLMRRLSEKYGKHVVAVWIIDAFGPDEVISVMVQFGDSTPAKKAMLACLSDFVRSTKESMAITAFPNLPTGKRGYRFPVGTVETSPGVFEYPPGKHVVPPEAFPVEGGGLSFPPGFFKTDEPTK